MSADNQPIMSRNSNRPLWLEIAQASAKDQKKCSKRATTLQRQEGHNIFDVPRFQPHIEHASAVPPHLETQDEPNRPKPDQKLFLLDLPNEILSRISRDVLHETFTEADSHNPKTPHNTAHASTRLDLRLVNKHLRDTTDRALEMELPWCYVEGSEQLLDKLVFKLPKHHIVRVDSDNVTSKSRMATIRMPASDSQPPSGAFIFCQLSTTMSLWAYIIKSHPRSVEIELPFMPSHFEAQAMLVESLHVLGHDMSELSFRGRIPTCVPAGIERKVQLSLDPTLGGDHESICSHFQNARGYASRLMAAKDYGSVIHMLSSADILHYWQRWSEPSTDLVVQTLAVHLRMQLMQARTQSLLASLEKKDLKSADETASTMVDIPERCISETPALTDAEQNIQHVTRAKALVALAVNAQYQLELTDWRLASRPERNKLRWLHKQEEALKVAERILWFTNKLVPSETSVRLLYMVQGRLDHKFLTRMSDRKIEATQLMNRGGTEQPLLNMHNTVCMADQHTAFMWRRILHHPSMRDITPSEAERQFCDVAGLQACFEGPGEVVLPSEDAAQLDLSSPALVAECAEELLERYEVRIFKQSY